MSRSHLRHSACVVVVTILLLAPAVLHAQPAGPMSGPPVASSFWSVVWHWVDDFLGLPLPGGPAMVVHSRTAPAQVSTGSKPAPGDWQCTACADAGPGMDPNG